MNPVFVKWWQSIGGTAQVTLILAILTAFFGLVKYLFEKLPKTAILIGAVCSIGILAFIFWPASATPVVSSKAKPKPAAPVSHETPTQGRADPR
jgi:hypothetical protein